ncbi:MAG TPA: ABC transporter ATP-binding protein [Sedimentisphaerales bacterium]|nr:ABC transporter ATP-binding protein [Sedimentisphaerales bacterium]
MLKLNKISKRYGDVWAVRDVSLELARGEMLVLLGPSGSGKTTILKTLAGLEIPTAGEIWVEGVELSGVPPHRRGLGMVFQNYALFPHMRVKDNIAFPLKMRRSWSKGEIAAMVEDILRIVQLEGYGERYPTQLSGGQQQRVALARALVFKPPLVLMDEPLGALDKKLRSAMQLEIKRIQTQLRLTMVYVTHDQEEALTLADRIAVMNLGRIEQIDRPESLYEHPRNPFVADFIGESNLLAANLLGRTDSKCLVELAGGVRISYVAPEGWLAGGGLVFVVRPEKVVIGTALPVDTRRLEGHIENVIYLGETVKYLVTVGPELRIAVKEQITGAKGILAVGTAVQIGWHDDHCRLLPRGTAEVAPRAEP